MHVCTICTYILLCSPNWQLNTSIQSNILKVSTQWNLKVLLHEDDIMPLFKLPSDFLQVGSLLKSHFLMKGQACRSVSRNYDTFNFCWECHGKNIQNVTCNGCLKSFLSCPSQKHFVKFTTDSWKITLNIHL